MTSTASSPSLHRDRLKALRASLKQQGLDGVIIPRQDEFQGEYVAPYAERLRWLTGFSGSWGLAIATLQHAAIFVDGRYTIQVRQQVDEKSFVPRHLMNEPPADWIASHVLQGQRIGFDPWILTANDAAKFRKACDGVGASLVPMTRNAIDAIWDGQPPRPASRITAHPVRFAGASAKDKLAHLAEGLKTAKADAVVLADPTSLAWALNLRASDIPFTPVALAYAIVDRAGTAQVYADPARVDDALLKAVGAVASFSPPARLQDDLALLGQRKATVRLDPATTPEAIVASLQAAGAQIVEAVDPCTLPRAQKTQAEQKGARAAQLRDGAALANFLCWLETHPRPASLTEAAVAQKLAAFRQATGKLRDLSFETIPASGPNAALPHYHLSTPEGRKLKRGEIFLIDSGGQYEDGTTDVTRTVVIGKPTAEMMDRFTRVLKGMIAISVCRFPQGTTGAHLDVLARQSLWQAGLEFDHGTGHGVGSYLSVHEGPARISKTGHHALLPGMIISNEPGYYKVGHYGIRTENLLLVEEPSFIKGGDRPMLGFETLTLAPIDRRLIVPSLLNAAEKSWLNAYHARVLKELSPLVDPATRKWLKQVCAPVK